MFNRSLWSVCDPFPLKEGRENTNTAVRMARHLNAPSREHGYVRNVVCEEEKTVPALAGLFALTVDGVAARLANSCLLFEEHKTGRRE